MHLNDPLTSEFIPRHLSAVGQESEPKIESQGESAKETFFAFLATFANVNRRR